MFQYQVESKFCFSFFLFFVLLFYGPFCSIRHPHPLYYSIILVWFSTIPLIILLSCIGIEQFILNDVESRSQSHFPLVHCFRTCITFVILFFCGHNLFQTHEADIASVRAVNRTPEFDRFKQYYRLYLRVCVCVCVQVYMYWKMRHQDGKTKWKMWRCGTCPTFVHFPSNFEVQILFSNILITFTVNFAFVLVAILYSGNWLDIWPYCNHERRYILAWNVGCTVKYFFKNKFLHLN